MDMLFAAAAVFLGIHLLVAGTRIRDGVVAVIGEGPYLGLFSLASLGAIVWLAMSYGTARASGDNRALYDLGPVVHDLGVAAVFLAFSIGVPGLLTPNPASVGQEKALDNADAVRGILRVTRHPFLWGVAIWSAFHLGVNGDLASVILFGTFLALSLFGTVSIDIKRRRRMGEAWTAFAGKTSNVPFGAILSGRNAFRLGEYLDWRFLVALLLFAAVSLAHAPVIGVSPFPGGWAPF